MRHRNLICGVPRGCCTCLGFYGRDMIEYGRKAMARSELNSIMQGGRTLSGLYLRRYSADMLYRKIYFGVEALRHVWIDRQYGAMMAACEQCDNVI